jgi:tRNA nucleotidyltransferase/poly(A) polymerase
VNLTYQFLFSELTVALNKALPEGRSVYLVGGAIRDALLQKKAHDLDFVLSGDPKPVARRVAEELNAMLYLLDDERNTVRVLYPGADGSRFTIDFATLRGPDLLSDLRGRDFTINAIAVDINQPNQLLDPLGGGIDLLEKRLRACSPQAFMDDPLRILRGVRLATDLSFQIDPETRQSMRQAVPSLPGISTERIRDELFRILGGSQPVTAFRLLDWLDCLPHLLPELPGLKNVPQTPPHTLDVWEHTLSVLQSLGILLDVLASEQDPNSHGNYLMGLASLRLGRYRDSLMKHFKVSLNPNRSLQSLLAFSALYHDISKPGTAQVDVEGRIRNFGHEKIGAEIAFHRSQAIQLSNVESERVRTVVRHHMRIHQLVQTGEPPSRRAIYRFFRDTSVAGIDICLLSLADTLGTYGTTITQDKWLAYLDVVRTMFENWWEKSAETVLPTPLVNGHDLQQILGLRPGPRLGLLLEAIREAQAMGQITERDQALAFAREWIGKKKI